MSTDMISPLWFLQPAYNSHTISYPQLPLFHIHTNSEKQGNCGQEMVCDHMNYWMVVETVGEIMLPHNTQLLQI
jgi:hypothetical protein